MADIDDFFAKKDKKKKGTKKFSKANTEVIAKNLIETERKELKEQEKQDKELGTPFTEEKPVSAQNSQEEEEWDDYRESKRDYTGLKIESLTIEDHAPEPEEDETEINEDGEVVKIKKDESGPWNKLGGSGSTESQEPVQNQSENDPSIPMPNVVAGSYVPPHLRAGGGPAQPTAEQRRAAQRRSKTAPDISSEVYFPTLSSAQEDGGLKGAWGRRQEEVGGNFEEVRDRGKQGYSRQSEAPRLALGNKFAALREGD